MLLNLITPIPPAIQRIVDAVYPVPRQLLAEQLARVDRPLFFFASGLELLFLLWFFYGGASTQLRFALEQKIRAPFILALAFIAIVFVGLSVIMLPVTFYGGFVIPHQFGLSLETVGRWIRDFLVSLALSTAIIAIVGALLLRIIARWRIWPLVAAALAAILLVFGNAIYPVFVAPLFNRFTPLPPSPLTDAILQLGSSVGINASVVYQYNMSVQTLEANAYVAGLDGTERIAVGDTLLRGLRPDEVVYVMAHEMGHYVLHHLWLGTLYTWVGALVLIAFVATIGAALLRRTPQLATGLYDPAAAPLVGALILVFVLLTNPVANALSRGIEHAADAFAGEHTHLGDAGVRAQARIADIDLAPLHPPPLVVWYFYSHPPTDQRIIDAARLAHMVR